MIGCAFGARRQETGDGAREAGDGSAPVERMSEERRGDGASGCASRGRPLQEDAPFGVEMRGGI